MKHVRYYLVRIFIFIVLYIAVIPTAHPVNAQDTVKLTVGEIASGVLTAASPNVTFTLTGKKGDYAVISFTSAGKERASADLSLLDSSGKVIAEDKNILSSGYIFTQFSADGDYTVQLKSKVSAGKDGVYAVQWLPVKMLAVGDNADAEITSRLVADDGKQVASGAYFLVKSDKDFKLTMMIGEQKGPDQIKATASYRISQPRENGKGMSTIFQAIGSDVSGLSVMLKSSPQFYLLELDYSGFATTGKPDKDMVVSQKFTISAEGM